MRETWHTRKEEYMSENKGKELPEFDSTKALTEFFDGNDLGDYLYEMPEVDFEVDLNKRTRYVAVEEEIARQISEISKQEHVPSGVIVNKWLREKVSNYPKRD